MKSKTASLFSKFIKTINPGDILSAANRRLIEEAVTRIRRHAYRLAAKRIRGSRLIDELRRQIDLHPDWRKHLTALEQKVIELKFGRTGAGDEAERSVSETARLLGVTKPMINYHLKSAARKLQAAFGVLPIDNLAKADNDRSPATDSAGLMRDFVWQEIIKWQHDLQDKDAESLRITDREIKFLRDLEHRLQAIEEFELKSETAAPGQSPGRKNSPERYRRLREILLARSALLDGLTARQRDALTTGLALEYPDPAEGGELGFRRFDASENMTRQNFNYFFNECLKKLRLKDENIKKS